MVTLPNWPRMSPVFNFSLRVLHRARESQAIIAYQQRHMGETRISVTNKTAAHIRELGRREKKKNKPLRLDGQGVGDSLPRSSFASKEGARVVTLFYLH